MAEKPPLPGFETAELVAEECIRRSGLTFMDGEPMVNGSPLRPDPWGRPSRASINFLVGYHWHAVREMAEEPRAPGRTKPRFRYSLPPRADVFRIIRARLREMEKESEKSISKSIDKSTAIL